MNFMEADALVESEPKLSMDDTSLLGWKMACQELDPQDRNTSMILAKIIRDCQGIGGTRSIPHRIARNERNGFLLVMTRPPHLPLY